MSKEYLRFPSGRTVKKIKQDAKKVKVDFANNTEALNYLAKKNGVDLPWDKAIRYIETANIGQDRGGLDRLVLSREAKRNNVNIIQISHTYDEKTAHFYLVTKMTKHEVESIVATLFYLCEDSDFLPAYSFGSVSLSSVFVSNILKSIFNEKIIKLFDFDYENQSQSNEDLEVEVVNCFFIEDGFRPSDYDISRYTAFMMDNQTRIVSIYREYYGVPDDINESNWQLLNVNENVDESHGLPLVLSGLTIQLARLNKHHLEKSAVNKLAKEYDEPGLYPYCEYVTKKNNTYRHTLPVYKIIHADVRLEIK